MVTVRHAKVADQVWIALALLLRENRDKEAFAASEIMDRVSLEFGQVAPGIPTHIGAHCVAAAKPNPGRHRMLVRVSRGKFRLFRLGDHYHSDRGGGKAVPNQEDIPEKYRFLLEWYDTKYGSPIKTFGPDAFLLRLKAGASGHEDVSESHDQYLVDDHQKGYPGAAVSHPA